MRDEEFKVWREIVDVGRGLDEGNWIGMGVSGTALTGREESGVLKDDKLTDWDEVGELQVGKLDGDGEGRCFSCGGLTDDSKCGSKEWLDTGSSISLQL